MRCRRSHPTQVGGRGCASKSQKLMWSEPRTNSPSGQTAPSIISHTASSKSCATLASLLGKIFSILRFYLAQTRSLAVQTQVHKGGKNKTNTNRTRQRAGSTAPRSSSRGKDQTRWAAGSRRPASAFTARSRCQSWEHFICALCQLKKLVSNRAGRWKPVRQACGLAQAYWAGIRPP